MHMEHLARALSGLVTTPDPVHPHPWYANLTGHQMSLLYGIPQLITGHSLRHERQRARRPALAACTAPVNAGQDRRGIGFG
jgi:hypothetical protein